MKNSGIGLLDSLAASMQTLVKRQSVIAENIANADTPGYRARVVPDDFASKLPGPGVALSDRMVALGAKPIASIGSGVKFGSSDVKPNGNSVSLEDEMLALGRVQSDYATASSLYKKSVGLLKIALGKGGA